MPDSTKKDDDDDDLVGKSMNKKDLNAEERDRDQERDK